MNLCVMTLAFYTYIQSTAKTWERVWVLCSACRTCIYLYANLNKSSKQNVETLKSQCRRTMQNYTGVVKTLPACDLWTFMSSILILVELGFIGLRKGSEYV